MKSKSAGRNKPEVSSGSKRPEEVFQFAFEGAPNAMIMVNKEGAIGLVNQQTEKLFGYTREELIGKKIEMLVPERYRAKHPGYRDSFFADPKPRSMGVGRDLVGLKKDKTEIPIEIGLNPIETPEGLYTLASMIDITERKRAEERLAEERKNMEKVNLELDSFVYTASHDLRAPLRGVSSFCTFLEEDYKDKLDEKGQRYLVQIRSGAGRMSEMIESLLALSRISRIENPYEDVDMGKLIDSVVERVEFDIKTMKCDLKIQENLPMVYCDGIKMAEVFLNLINNAVKFSSKNAKTPPRVEIGYADKNEHHLFFVKDNGIGIDPQYQEKIFKIFERLHPSEVYEGTGVGLSIVKRVIGDHGGRVWVESELGRGAAFYFTIPKDLKGRQGKKLGEILVDEGLLSQEKLKEALNKQKEGGSPWTKKRD